MYGILLLWLGVYAAWCGRSFYTKPPLKFHPSAAFAEVDTASRWYKETGELTPVPFDFKRYLYHLKNPWKPVHYPVEVSSELGSGFGNSDRNGNLEGRMRIAHQRREWIFTRTFGEFEYRFQSARED
jgi:hypothetical protein